MREVLSRNVQGGPLRFRINATIVIAPAAGAALCFGRELLVPTALEHVSISTGLTRG
jgi:hypothetical protein